MAIQRALDLSTAHLTPRDMSLMTDACDLYEEDEVGRFPVRITSHQYGWVLFLPDDENKPENMAFRDKGFSENLICVLEYAYKHKCMFINFDQDADAIPGLPVDDHAAVETDGCP